MSNLASGFEYCKGGCGTPTLHRSGKCEKCRKEKCAKCKNDFIPKPQHVGLICSKCAAKMRLIEKKEYF